MFVTVINQNFGITEEDSVVFEGMSVTGMYAEHRLSGFLMKVNLFPEPCYVFDSML